MASEDPTPEADEADAIEQAQPVDDVEPDEPHLGPEVPEADAIEQAQVVPLDEDEEPR